MRMGELAGQVGVNTKTIRYYESIGVLPEPGRKSSELPGLRRELRLAVDVHPQRAAAGDHLG